MTISKGQPWGEPGPLGPNGIVVESDAQGARAIADARKRGAPLPELGLLGGDLCRTLGGSGSRDRLVGNEARRYPIDLGIAIVDGKEMVFLAHAVARRRMWRGPIVVAMNAQHIGTWDLGPKSHPNDGLLDITQANLSLGERLAARKRLPTGTHVPHPAISTRRCGEFEISFARRQPIYLDKIAVARCQTLQLRVIPDAITVVI